MCTSILSQVAAGVTCQAWSMCAHVWETKHVIRKLPKWNAFLKGAVAQNNQDWSGALLSQSWVLQFWPIMHWPQICDAGMMASKHSDEKWQRRSVPQSEQHMTSEGAVKPFRLARVSRKCRWLNINKDLSSFNQGRKYELKSTNASVLHVHYVSSSAETTWNPKEPFTWLWFYHWWS